MLFEEQRLYRPIVITLETEKEAQELLGILTKVNLHGSSFEAQEAFLHLRDLLREKLRVPMTGLYHGVLERN